MKHVVDLIQAWLGGELAGPEHEAVNAHLAACPACAREAERAQAVWDLLDTAAAEMAPVHSAWPGVQARTFGASGGDVFYGRSLWSKVGVATLAVAAGLSLAVLLPRTGSRDGGLAGSDSDSVKGGSFWLDEQSSGAFSELWLAAAEEGTGS